MWKNGKSGKFWKCGESGISGIKWESEGGCGKVGNWNTGKVEIWVSEKMGKCEKWEMWETWQS